MITRWVGLGRVSCLTIRAAIILALGPQTNSHHASHCSYRHNFKNKSGEFGIIWTTHTVRTVRKVLGGNIAVLAVVPGSTRTVPRSNALFARATVLTRGAGTLIDVGATTPDKGCPLLPHARRIGNPLPAVRTPNPTQASDCGCAGIGRAGGVARRSKSFN
eukprot:COSAG04_NODE_13867_length_589_cov_0.838776_1_plen_160_part_01